MGVGAAKPAQGGDSRVGLGWRVSVVRQERRAGRGRGAEPRTPSGRENKEVEVGLLAQGGRRQLIEKPQAPAVTMSPKHQRTDPHTQLEARELLLFLANRNPFSPAKQEVHAGCSVLGRDSCF